MEVAVKYKVLLAVFGFLALASAAQAESPEYGAIFQITLLDDEFLDNPANPTLLVAIKSKVLGSLQENQKVVCSEKINGDFYLIYVNPDFTFSVLKYTEGRLSTVLSAMLPLNDKHVTLLAEKTTLQVNAGWDKKTLEFLTQRKGQKTKELPCRIVSE